MQYRTFEEARSALEREETTVEALVQESLAAIEAGNERLNVFLSVDAEGALEAARAVDARRKKGEPLPLDGMVLGLKDVLAVKGQPLTCGSRMLEDFRSLYTATAVERLFEAGAVSVGKLNCDEFAMGSSNEHSAFGPVKNPVDESRIPGGSSGGSAAAVAAGMVHTALGTDTGGSVRLPGAFTGTVALRPTYGRISRFGLTAFASSLDCIGPIAHTVRDAAAVLGVMAGTDPNDATSAPVDVPDYTAALTGDIEGLRVGFSPEYLDMEGLDEGVRRSIEAELERLADLGADLAEVSLPHTKYGIATYYILVMAEASSNLARYDGIRYGHTTDLKALEETHAAEREHLEAALAEAGSSNSKEAQQQAQQALDNHPDFLEAFYTANRSEGFGDEVKRRLMLGAYVLSSGYYDAYYDKAQRVRALTRSDFDRAFEQVDVIVGPANATPPWEIGEVQDPLEEYLADVFMAPASLAGIPGLIVPADLPHPSGLPVGVQILGRPFDEATVLRVGDTLFSHRSLATGH